MLSDENVHFFSLTFKREIISRKQVNNNFNKYQKSEKYINQSL
jgi:hypothetical protein